MGLGSDLRIRVIFSLPLLDVAILNHNGVVPLHCNNALILGILIRTCRALAAT